METEPINNINCTETFDRETNESFGCEWEMILTDETADNLSRTFFPHIEIPLLQGTKTVMHDGRTRYTFALDNEMSKGIRQALLLAIMPVSGN